MYVYFNLGIVDKRICLFICSGTFSYNFIILTEFETLLIVMLYWWASVGIKVFRTHFKTYSASFLAPTLSPARSAKNTHIVFCFLLRSNRKTKKLPLCVHVIKIVHLHLYEIKLSDTQFDSEFNFVEIM